MSKTKYNYTLLYAEDDSCIREGYLYYFQTIFKDVYEACDGEEAYLLYKKHQPDIILVDINMPKLDGLSLIEKIRQRDQNIYIVILSAHKEEEKLLRAIPLALTKYLVKPVKKNELDTLFETLVKSLNLRENPIQEQENICWDRDLGVLRISNQTIHLTRNELILMNLLSSKAQKDYSLDDILSEYWQVLPQKDMTHNSIRSIIKRLKAKLPKHCIENHYGIGYKLCI